MNLNGTMRLHTRPPLPPPLDQSYHILDSQSLCGTANSARRCRLRVRSGHCLRIARCLLYPQKRTLAETAVMSALCQKQTSLAQLLRQTFSKSGKCQLLLKNGSGVGGFDRSDNHGRSAVALFRNQPADLSLIQLSASCSNAKPLTCSTRPYRHETRTYHPGAVFSRHTSNVGSDLFCSMG